MAPLTGVVLSTVRRAHAGSGAGLLNTRQQATRSGRNLVERGIYFAAREIEAHRLGVLAA